MDGGMLSQEEINALLNGMAVPDGEASDAGSNDTSATADMTSKTFDVEPEAYLRDSAPVNEDESFSLTDVEKDAIGEVANISMGSSATTLYSLVNRKVNITTPEVELADWDSILKSYERPCVFIQIKYTKGLDGTNILVLREHDVKVITDLMMGGDGTNTDGELGELHLSAISEAMNQMMGAAATSLSTMLQAMIDISPPDASLVDLSKYASGGEISPFLAGTFVKVSFRMQIDALVDSSLMQLYPIDFSKKLVETFIDNQTGGGNSSMESSSAPTPTPVAPAPAAPTPTVQQPAAPPPQPQNMGMPQGGMDMSQAQQPMGQMPNMGMPYPYPYPYPQQPYPAQYGMPMGMPPQAPANIQPATFQAFNPDNAGSIVGQENIGLIMDVPLEVTVELGRTSKSISEILDFAPGTIIELNRIAGEPIDVLVNGKFVAKGEVVVIEENFGIRVTEIIKDAKKANLLP